MTFPAYSLKFLLQLLKWKYFVFESNHRFLFPEKTETSRKELYHSLLKNVSRHAVEFLIGLPYYQNLPNSFENYPFRKSKRDFSIPEESVRVLKKMREGGLMLAAHFGNYEAIGPWLCALEVPLKASYAQIQPAILNRILTQKLRAAKGKPYSLFIDQPRKILSLLDENHVFCLVADQDYRKPNTPQSLFFNRPVAFNPLPGFILKYRPQTPVFVVWIEEQNLSYSLNAQELLPYQKKTPEILARSYHEWLEKRIQDKPELWYGWFHRRFFSRNASIY